mmetsp:Transcript_12439/g.30042  ORF Transcript_12439/g.30042 Transcript_12439/m.30042 type:complete len:303 (-) Transcript_12439:129-1037(-)|eukprot:CAMPEP_0197588926 /NCGR_PEP_ID=MMETSP1326-20131121/10040_1 /TAXON_ID=1155430 /ORGANISM="Genus nov. species nov., Strain RCC2288" /LENGTH=302 /DNA_ID=CAMNT_0043153805 /DNA_START=7 /DNA_END=915 /DNA_ORIENTATION=+
MTILMATTSTVVCVRGGGASAGRRTLAPLQPSRAATFRITGASAQVVKLRSFHQQQQHAATGRRSVARFAVNESEGGGGAPPSPEDPTAAEAAARVMSPAEAARAAEAAAALNVKKGGGARKADSTDAISSFLTRRFGIAGGLAWLGILTFGVVTEQLKTRREVREAAEGTLEVAGAALVEVTTPSGLRYTDSRTGGGEQPRPGYLLAANVVATVDSTGAVVLDTRKVGRQLIFTFGRPQGPICKGVMEGVGTMKQGGKRTMVVPAELAFGEDGATLSEGSVPPGASVTYEVELTRVSIPPS